MGRNIQWQGLIEAGLYGVSSFFVALFLAWLFLAPQNFWYGLWHDKAGIGVAIQTYGPQNKYRKGFAETSREERIDMFGQINWAIHNGGEGLAEIEYTSRFGTQRLLRTPEVVHLQDVANLISFLKWVVAGIGLVWFGFLIRAYYKGTLPPLYQQLKGIGLSMAVALLALMLVGPARVFNTLHVWVFPGDHQWFFYYQDSLMSTMMKAPVLFGWIAGALMVWAIVFYCILQWLLYKVVMPRLWKLAS